MKALVVLFAVLVSSSAFASDCFSTVGIRGFQNDGRDAVILDTMRGDYRVETFVCFDLEWANAIDFRSRIGSSRICKGDDLLVVDEFNGHVKQTCRIAEITKL